MTLVVTGSRAILGPLGLYHCCGRLVQAASAGIAFRPASFQFRSVYTTARTWAHSPDILNTHTHTHKYIVCVWCVSFDTRMLFWGYISSDEKIKEYFEQNQVLPFSLSLSVSLSQHISFNLSLYMCVCECTRGYDWRQHTEAKCRISLQPGYKSVLLQIQLCRDRSTVSGT